MKILKIFVFGNEDLQMDSLPLRILPKLREEFLDIKFEVVDPNEEWDFSSRSRNCMSFASESNDPDFSVTIIDTALGIKDVTVFESLEKFSSPPRVGMHDFDALTNIRYLWKLGKIKKIKIIAVPPEMGENEAIKKVSATLR